jgi:hypothetical protein
MQKMNRSSSGAIGQGVVTLVIVFGGLGALSLLGIGLLWVLLGGGGIAWVCVVLGVAGLAVCLFIFKAASKSAATRVNRVLTEVNKRFGTSFTATYLVHNASTLLAFDREQKKVLISPPYDHEKAEIRDFDYIRLVTTDGKQLILSLSDVDRPTLRMPGVFLTENIASDWTARINLILEGR